MNLIHFYDKSSIGDLIAGLAHHYCLHQPESENALPTGPVLQYSIAFV